MENERNVQSVLQMRNLVFEKIEFKRTGFTSESEVKFHLESNISKKNDEEVYKTTLTITGEKQDEYFFEISLAGFFLLDPDDEMTEELKNSLLTQNTVAILMPYLRSEVSLLTAQPGLDCVVLPPFNINKMMKPES